MSNLDSLSSQWKAVVEDILALEPMRSGSVCGQKVKYRTRDGIHKSHGPYPIPTFKENGKTRTLRLESAEQVEIAKKQVERFRQFRQLTRHLIGIGKELGDRVTGDELLNVAGTGFSPGTRLVMARVGARECFAVCAEQQNHAEELRLHRLEGRTA